MLLWFGIGTVIVVISVGWTLGPFKTPMAWSEGALMSYQGNANPDGGGHGPSGWGLMAVPAFAFVAGVLLLAAAGVTAAM
jgi:hypothetical protein